MRATATRRVKKQERKGITVPCGFCGDVAVAPDSAVAEVIRVKGCERCRKDGPTPALGKDTRIKLGDGA